MAGEQSKALSLQFLDVPPQMTAMMRQLVVAQLTTALRTNSVTQQDVENLVDGLMALCVAQIWSKLKASE